MNIRGSDNPNSPMPNGNLLIGKNGNIFLIAKKEKVLKLIRDKRFKKNEIIKPEDFKILINKLQGKNFIIDDLTCSIFNENIIKSKFKIIKRDDPCYKLNL